MHLKIVLAACVCALILVCQSRADIACGERFESFSALFLRIKTDTGAPLEDSSASLAEFAAYSSIEFIPVSEGVAQPQLLVVRADLRDPRTGASRLRSAHGNGPFYFLKAEGKTLVVVGQASGNGYQAEWHQGKLYLKLWWHVSAAMQAPGWLMWDGHCLVTAKSPSE